MDKYLLMHFLGDTSSQPAGHFEEHIKPQVEAWRQEMEGRGLLIDGAALDSEFATTVRNREPGAPVEDGPFAETEERLTGIDLIEARDLEEAVAAASAHPTLRAGAIEVRPLVPGMPTPAPAEPKPGKRRYVMLVCWDQTGDAEILAEDLDDENDPMADWIEETGDRRLHGWQLQPPSLAHTVREVDGSPVVIDGPFAETKEQIGGYDLLECEDLDEAIGIARAHGATILDLRPVSGD